MADDHRLSDDDSAARELLLHTLKQSVEAAKSLADLNRDLVRITREALERANGHPNGHVQQAELPGLPPRRAPRNRRPQKSGWRTWRGFCEDLQREASLLRKDRVEVTKIAVATRVGCDPKTISRTMAGYGLDPDDWPPFAWDPAEAREWRPNAQVTNLG